MQGLVDRVGTLRPELAELTHVNEGINGHVRIELPPDRHGYARRLVLAPFRARSSFFWLVVGPRDTERISQVWPLDVEDDHLAAAAVEVWDACVADRQLRSPWRWGQPVMSEAVEMAEALAAAGLEVDAVAADNRVVPDEIEGDESPVTVPRSLGDPIRIRTDWCLATLWRKPTLGWVLDANDTLDTRRLRLPVSSRPHVGEDRDMWLRGFASAVSAALREPWGVAAGYKVPGDAWFGRRWPAHEAVAWWLEELGLGDVHVRDDDRDMPEFLGNVYPLMVEHCGLGVLQRAFAKATVARKTLIAFAAGGFTRDAKQWGEEAGVLCFNLGGEGARFPLSAATANASDYIPKVI